MNCQNCGAPLPTHDTAAATYHEGIMCVPESSREQLLEQFVEWAKSRPDVSAAALVGSAARAGYPADEWSDLDLIVVTADPQFYLSSTSWLGAIGEPWISTVERTPGGKVVERRVLFAGAIDVDWIVLAKEQASEALRSPPIADILCRGMKVLIDKDGTLASLSVSPANAQGGQPPTESEFEETVNDFWFHAVWTAKKLMRGELWTAKSCCDAYMKGLLLRMVAWHARAVRGWELDTWYGGRFLERWASPGIVAALGSAFGHYNKDDVWRALAVTMDLFRGIATETAGRLAYPYPTSADEHATAWVARCRSERNGTR